MSRSDTEFPSSTLGAAKRDDTHGSQSAVVCVPPSVALEEPAALVTVPQSCHLLPHRRGKASAGKLTVGPFCSREGGAIRGVGAGHAHQLLRCHDNRHARTHVAAGRVADALAAVGRLERHIVPRDCCVGWGQWRQRQQVVVG